MPVDLAASFGDGWPSIGAFIALAGGVYPLTLAIVAFIVGIVREGLPGPTELILIAVIVTFTGGAVGTLLATLAILIVFPLTYVVLSSLKLRGNLVWLGAFCGGLVGFTSVIAVMTQFQMFQELSDAWGMAIVLLIGPALTTVLGQIGGAWGGRWAIQRPNWYERAVAAAHVSQKSNVNHVPLPDESMTHQSAHRPRLRFGIAHLLWLAVWISVLLSVIRLLGISFEFALPLLLGWIVYQGATLWLGGKIVGLWNASRNYRSTRNNRQLNRRLCVPRGTHKSRMISRRRNPRSRFT